MCAHTKNVLPISFVLFISFQYDLSYSQIKTVAYSSKTILQIQCTYMFNRHFLLSNSLQESSVEYIGLTGNMDFQIYALIYFMFSYVTKGN